MRWMIGVALEDSVTSALPPDVNHNQYAAPTHAREAKAKIPATKRLIPSS